MIENIETNAIIIKILNFCRRNSENVSKNVSVSPRGQQLHNAEVKIKTKDSLGLS